MYGEILEKVLGIEGSKSESINETYKKYHDTNPIYAELRTMIDRIDETKLINFMVYFFGAEETKCKRFTKKCGFDKPNDLISMDQIGYILFYRFPLATTFGQDNRFHINDVLDDIIGYIHLDISKEMAQELLSEEETSTFMIRLSISCHKLSLSVRNEIMKDGEYVRHFHISTGSGKYTLGNGAFNEGYTGEKSFNSIHDITEYFQNGIEKCGFDRLNIPYVQKTSIANDYYSVNNNAKIEETTFRDSIFEYQECEIYRGTDVVKCIRFQKLDIINTNNKIKEMSGTAAAEAKKLMIDFKGETTKMSYSIHHSNIVKFHMVDNDPTYIYFSYHGIKMSEINMEKINYDTKLRWLYQITSALKYLHAKGVYCYNPIPENILIDDNDDVKLIVYPVRSSASFYVITDTFKKLCKEYQPFPPETDKLSRYSSRSEVFRLAPIILWMLTGKNYGKAHMNLIDSMKAETKYEKPFNGMRLSANFIDKYSFDMNNALEDLDGFAKTYSIWLEKLYLKNESQSMIWHPLVKFFLLFIGEKDTSRPNLHQICNKLARVIKYRKDKAYNKANQDPEKQIKLEKEIILNGVNLITDSSSNEPSHYENNPSHYE